jgi:hypothetical protein
VRFASGPLVWVAITAGKRMGEASSGIVAAWRITEARRIREEREWPLGFRRRITASSTIWIAAVELPVFRTADLGMAPIDSLTLGSPPRGR